MNAPEAGAAERVHQGPPAPRTVLLTGATGYVGGRLLPALEARGLGVRCLARRPAYLARRVGPGTEVVAGFGAHEKCPACADGKGPVVRSRDRLTFSPSLPHD